MNQSTSVEIESKLAGARDALLKAQRLLAHNENPSARRSVAMFEQRVSSLEADYRDAIRDEQAAASQACGEQLERRKRLQAYERTLEDLDAFALPDDLTEAAWLAYLATLDVQAKLERAQADYDALHGMASGAYNRVDGRLPPPPLPRAIAGDLSRLLFERIKAEGKRLIWRSAAVPTVDPKLSSDDMAEQERAITRLTAVR